MANFAWPGLIRTMVTTATPGVAIVATAYTASDDFVTAGEEVKAFEFVGIVLDVSVDGTGTFDAGLEMSFDDGTTWQPLPADINSQTQAAITQITSATISILKYWRLPAAVVPNKNCQVRLNVVITGGSADYDIDVAKWIFFGPRPG